MKIKIKAMTAKGMAAMLDWKLHQRTLDAALNEAADEALELYRKTVRTWSTRVVFYKRRMPGRQGIFVGTTNKIYTYVDAGTRPHIIKPKKAGGRLAFQTGGRPKTRPGIITSYAGAKGSKWARPMVVHHPGGKARRFTEIINDRIDKRLASITRRRIKQLVDRYRRRGKG